MYANTTIHSRYAATPAWAALSEKSRVGDLHRINKDSVMIAITIIKIILNIFFLSLFLYSIGPLYHTGGEIQSLKPYTNQGVRSRTIPIITGEAIAKIVIQAKHAKQKRPKVLMTRARSLSSGWGRCRKYPSGTTLINFILISLSILLLYLCICLGDS